MEPTSDWEILLYIGLGIFWLDLLYRILFRKGNWQRGRRRK